MFPFEWEIRKLVNWKKSGNMDNPKHIIWNYSIVVIVSQYLSWKGRVRIYKTEKYEKYEKYNVIGCQRAVEWKEIGVILVMLFSVRLTKRQNTISVDAELLDVFLVEISWH